MGFLVDDYYGTERSTATLAVNGSVKGQIQFMKDQDWFAVTLEAGVPYYLTGNGSGTTGFTIAFFDPRRDSFVAVHYYEWEKNGTLEFTPDRSGTFYAVAMDTYGNMAINDYTLNLATRSTPDDLPSNSSTKGVLTLDTPVLGVYEQAGDKDWIKFHAEKGYHYTFLTEGRATADLGKGYQYSIEIKDASGRVVSRSNTFDPLEDGDYYVELAGEDAGGYKLSASRIADDYANELRGAAPLAIGAKVQGVLTYEFDDDWMRVDLEQGKFYTFKLEGVKGYGWDIFLHDGAGNWLGYNYGSMDEGGAQLIYQAKQTGAVFLQIERALTANTIGYPSPYSISVSSADDDIGQDAATAKAVTVGGISQGVLQASADRDAFKVSLEAGVTYRFALLAANGTGGAAKLELSGSPDGKLVASRGVGLSGSLEATPSSSGEYLLTVTGDTWLPPNQAYTLTVARAIDDWAANSSGAGTLAVGSSVNAKLDNAGDRDWFATRLEAGSTYWIEAKSAEYGAANGAVMRILDASGQAVATYTVPYGFAPLSFKPQTSGTYFVELSSPQQQTGSYLLTLAAGIPDDAGDKGATATALTAGTTFDGKLEVGADIDMYRLDTIAGQTYEVKLSGKGEYVYAKLCDADGKELANGAYNNSTSDGSRAIMFRAESNGTVYLMVRGNGAASYQLQPKIIPDDFTDMMGAAAPRLANGASISGGIDYIGDTDVFSVQLDAHRTYVYSLKSTTPGKAPPTLGLTFTGPSAPNEQSLVNGERILKITPQTSGQYFLDVRDYSLGGYTLTSLPYADDGNGPRVVTQSHANNATGVALTDRTITIKFSEAIKVDLSKIVLRDSAGKAVQVNFGAGGSYPKVIGDTLVMQSHGYLLPDTYTLSLPAAAIHDLDGNRYIGPESLTFTTVQYSSTATADNGFYMRQPGTIIDGGSGIDTFVSGRYSAFNVVFRDGADFVLWDGGAGTYETLRNIERLQFFDQIYAFDVDGNAGQAYRLYQAAFNRTPDLGGLGFWIGQLDKGLPLRTVADAFVGSNEFKTLYGSAPSNNTFIQALYQNVLHRSPDAAGFEFWNKAMQSGTSREEVLVHFSESAENKSALAEIIGDGFTYSSVWQS
ncbi:DUF4214 domain-containing protein [Pseudoduganella sp. OTU4001]|uniref:DUF4214 domain-containing protein n=1 Tax=Pseudoduganella sp. OTU4001 TaxID=3043854 RepID=UPI00313D3A37